MAANPESVDVHLDGQGVEEHLTRSRVLAILREKYLNTVAAHLQNGCPFVKLVNVGADCIEVELLDYGNRRFVLGKVFDYVNVFCSEGQIGRPGVRLFLSLIDIDEASERLVAYCMEVPALWLQDVTRGFSLDES